MIKLKLREMLAGVLTAVHHIGRVSWLAIKPTIDNFAGRLSGVGTPSAEILGSGKRTPHMHAFTAGSEKATNIGCSEIFAQTSWCRSAISGNGNEACSENSTA
ncbi:TPA: hypothetical protein ACXNDR_002412 [Serratia marcescens]